MKNIAKMNAFQNPTCVNHHQNVVPNSNRVRPAQLTEFRIEEHHEERVGKNILWAFILCFLNREPGHVTTLQKS